jgi:hypothetical protein
MSLGHAAADVDAASTGGGSGALDATGITLGGGGGGGGAGATDAMGAAASCPPHATSENIAQIARVDGCHEARMGCRVMIGSAPSR